MRKKQIKIINFELVLSFLAIFFFLNGTLLSTPTCSAEVVAIVHKNHDVAQMSFRDLKYIYEGKKKSWADGESIVLYLPPAKSEMMDTLATKVFKMESDTEVSKYYLKAIFQQVFSTPPQSVDDTQQAVREIAANPGGIAIVESNELPANSQVNVVKLFSDN
jgi:ABC-type phosphate transport system substrate-binding protein